MFCASARCGGLHCRVNVKADVNFGGVAGQDDLCATTCVALRFHDSHVCDPAYKTRTRAWILAYSTDWDEQRIRNTFVSCKEAV